MDAAAEADKIFSIVIWQQHPVYLLSLTNQYSSRENDKTSDLRFEKFWNLDNINLYGNVGILVTCCIFS